MRASAIKFPGVRDEGPDLDALTLGVIQINIHEITNRVAASLLIEKGLLEPPSSFQNARHGGGFRYFYQRSLVRTRIGNIRNGSIEQEVEFALAAAIADPDVRAILNNLSASLIFAIARSEVQTVRSRLQDAVSQPRRIESQDVGPNIRDIATAALENSNGRPASLRLTWRVVAFARSLTAPVDVLPV